MNLPIQFIEVQQINPLITKTTVKIMYTGKNRNFSYISKEVAEKMAASLRNIPIIGEYSTAEQDYLTHGDGSLKTTTIPIGVVPSDASIWWETYMDNDQIEREYMCCDAYIWTGRYPESKKIFQDGVNNQSMELDSDTIKGSWAQIENKGSEYFIIEEAIFTALCVLGEDVEPCFEGASINPPFYYVIDTEKDSVAIKMALLKQELSQALNQHAKEVTDFPSKGENKAITLRNSQWELFDPSFAQMIKEKHPDIWRLGGNIRGNSQYPKLSEAVGQSSEDLSNTLKDAIKLREAWIARHYKDFRIAGVIAQIKWLAVGSKGESYMKDLVKEEIKKRRKYQKEVNYLMEDKSMVDLLVEEPEVEMAEEEISLKDMIKEIVHEILSAMKSEEPVVEVEMQEDVEKPEAEVEMQLNYESEIEGYKAQVIELQSRLKEYESKEKMFMLEKFSMLDSVFIEEIKSTLDLYTVDQLEAKLSIEAVRSGLIFNSKKEEVATFSMEISKSETFPSWISVLEKL
jgi:hypothetical protein